MTKIIRPMRFDNVRRERKNAKRREAQRRRAEKKRAFMRTFNRMFWFDIEPEIMWDNSDWSDNGKNGGDNDNGL